MVTPDHKPDDLIATGRHLASRGLVTATDGNLSARVGPDRVLITAAGSTLGELTEADLLEINLDGEVISGAGRPSTETGMHLEVYALRPDVGAVVHAHPIFATAFAAAGEEIPWDVLPETALFVGPVPLTEYAAPGTEEVPRAVDRYLGSNQALLLRNHGVLAVGTTLEQATRRLDIIEHSAQILYHSRRLGTPQRIPEKDLERLNRLRQETENHNRE